MRTGIDKGADLAVGAAHDNQRHAHKVEGEVAARLGHPALMADAVPIAEKDPLALALVEPWRGVAPAGQGLGGVPASAHARVVAGLEDVLRLEIRDHRCDSSRWRVEAQRRASLSGNPQPVNAGARTVRSAAMADAVIEAAPGFRVGI